MKKTLSLLLVVILLVAATTTVYAEDAEYIIDLESVPYEDFIMPPWFTTDSMPYILEPYCIYLVYCNIFARLL